MTSPKTFLNFLIFAAALPLPLLGYQAVTIQQAVAKPTNQELAKTCSFKLYDGLGISETASPQELQVREHAFSCLRNPTYKVKVNSCELSPALFSVHSGYIFEVENVGSKAVDITVKWEPRSYEEPSKEVQNISLKPKQVKSVRPNGEPPLGRNLSYRIYCSSPSAGIKEKMVGLFALANYW